MQQDDLKKSNSGLLPFSINFLITLAANIFQKILLTIFDHYINKKSSQIERIIFITFIFKKLFLPFINFFIMQ